MNRLRTFLFTPAPRPFASRRSPRTEGPRSARTLSQRPILHPAALRGRDVSIRQRILSGWTGILPDILLTLLFITLSIAVSVQQVEKTSFHPDESRWMNRAYYARELSDPFGPVWQEYATTIGQPPLGSIVMGIGLAIQGHDLDATGSWDFAYGRDWNTRMGAMPTDEDRFAARRTNVVIGALVAGAIYVLGRLLTNRVGGTVAAAFIAWHPLHVVLATQALSDQTLSLLLALIFIMGWFFAKKPSWSRAIILGILLGLGGSVKLTPVLLAGPLAGFGLIRLLVHQDAAARRYAWMMLAQPAIAFATFVLSYPYLWPNPISRSWRLFAFRAQEMDGQSAAWPDTAVSGPLDSLSRFGHKLTYSHSTSQNALSHLYDWLGIERTAVGIDFIPVAGGVVLLIWWVARKGFWTPAAMVALLMGAEAGALVVGMKTDFYRYHLPIIVVMAGCISVSTGVAWSALTRLYTRSRQHALSPFSRPALQPGASPIRSHGPQTISTQASGELHQ